MKNKFGLIGSDMRAIGAILGNFPRVEKAILFGSRAKGTYKNGSDVDIALKGIGLNFNDLSKISYQLNEESLMPYKFDILIYHNIKEPDLIDHIDRIGVELYSKCEEVK